METVSSTIWIPCARIPLRMNQSIPKDVRNQNSTTITMTLTIIWIFVPRLPQVFLWIQRVVALNSELLTRMATESMTLKTPVLPPQAVRRSTQMAVQKANATVMAMVCQIWMMLVMIRQLASLSLTTAARMRVRSTPILTEMDILECTPMMWTLLPAYIRIKRVTHSLRTTRSGSIPTEMATVTIRLQHPMQMIALMKQGHPSESTEVATTMEMGGEMNLNLPQPETTQPNGKILIMMALATTGEIHLGMQHVTPITSGWK